MHQSVEYCIGQADHDIREADPFEFRVEMNLSFSERSPYVNRIRLMWSQMREVVINHFPAAPGIQPDHEAYFKNVEDLYTTDAYHSLSIERYRVTRELSKMRRYLSHFLSET